jgi:gamma-glutamyl phosphate reductase
MKHSYNSMKNMSVFMDREETMERIDNTIRVLSHLDSPHESNSEETLSLKNAIDKEDRPKLVNLLEDVVVLLRDDPDNKSKIKERWNKIMSGYGHIKPISEILESVNEYFL